MVVRGRARQQSEELGGAWVEGLGPQLSFRQALPFDRLCPFPLLPRLLFAHLCPPLSILLPTVSPVPPVVSSALTSASSSRVSRVTSLPGGVRARRPLPFREESHLRWMKVTWQSEQGVPPREEVLSTSGVPPGDSVLTPGFHFSIPTQTDLTRSLTVLLV